jgi:hypothetical protein
MGVRYAAALSRAALRSIAVRRRLGIGLMVETNKTRKKGLQ